ncbi:MAG: ester cyclase [Pseudomonadota bacterium]
MPPEITRVATTDIAEMMAPGPERRMALPGFADEFVDFPHFIIRITEKIWHEREVDRVLEWYADDCPIHTLAGDITGAQTVVDNTWATLDAFPDRRLDGDNVIWSDEGGGAFYSSHLITSKMTNQGDSEFGPATGRKVRIQTIADCLCANNQVVEEWLVRDNLALVQGLGFDPDEIAVRQAAGDQARGESLIQFHAEARGTAQDKPTPVPGGERAVDVAVSALVHTFGGDTAAQAGVYDFRVRASYPGNAQLYGPDEVSAWLAPLRKALPDLRLRVDHVAEIPYLGEAWDVALRWSAAGIHGGDGRYGPASGAPVYLLGVSHFRVMNGRVREEVTLWDDLAVRRQIAAARRAK